MEPLLTLIKEAYGRQPDHIEALTSKTPNPNDKSSFLVNLDKQKIKAIIFNDMDELADFLQYVPKLKRVPKIIARKDNIVLVEWLEGLSLGREDLTDGDLKEIAMLQAEIHSTKIRLDKTAAICASRDAFERNILYAQTNNILSQEEIENINRVFKGFFSKDLKVSLIHRDFNADNLLKTQKGWCSIDNETLASGITGLDFGKPIINICNMDKGRINTYLDAYNTISPVDFYTRDREKYDLFFLLKQVVSRHKNNLNFKKHLRILQEIMSATQLPEKP